MSIKRFSVWLEERQYGHVRHAQHIDRMTSMLLGKLGFDKKALEKQDIKLGIVNKERLKDAIDSSQQELGLSDEDIARKSPPQDELPGVPAVFPQGQPKPPPQQPPMPNPQMPPPMV